MTFKNWCRATTAFTALMIGAQPLWAAPYQQQDTARATLASNSDTATSVDAKTTDIIVTGIRQSVEKAREKKKNSKQIVDSVVAEDVGKLPDNNVPEALARVPGVQIDRVHGEGTSVTIRGLSDIQTTINGNDAASAGSRALSLSDIPAELLKSVDVYKTRSADQPEGGIAGTVNVELRRPLDLPKGLTVAGSFRETFSDIGNTKSPYGSLLLSERFDTGIGEMGFLLNAALTNNHYNENFVMAESPMQVPHWTGDVNGDGVVGPDEYAGSPAFLALPADMRGIIIPYAVTYGVESGTIRRPSLNAAWQWRPNDQLEFVLEGSYIGVRETDNQDYLKMVTNDGNGTYSDLAVNSDGTIQSLTLNNPNGVGGGPLSIYTKNRSDTYNANFETNWHSDDVHIKFGSQYNWSDSRNYFVQEQFRFKGGTQTHVDFNSPNIPGGGPYITFPNVDITDPNAYELWQVHDQNGDNHDTMFASNLDFTVDTSKTGLLRSVQFGARFTKRTMGYTYGYRDAFFFDVANGPTMTEVGSATGIGYVTTTPDIRNVGEIPSWYHYDNPQYYRNFGAVRQYLLDNGADLQGADWTKATPGSTDPGQGYGETERTFAAYGELNYAFNAHFPVDGTLGLRYVNTWGVAGSTQYTWLLDANGKIDPSYTLVMKQVSSHANYVDLLPSATATLHFTPKLQLRLSYTHNVQRPGFYEMRDFKELRDAVSSPTGIVWAGNPDLKAVQENSYDASLEYYFGRGGLLSLDTFLKNQTGFIYYTQINEFVPEVGSVHPVNKPRNAGPGKIFGIEAQANTFFDFLPSFAHNFGVNANFTYIPKSELHLYPADEVPDVPGVFQPPFTSKYTGNLVFFYEDSKFSARVAYNIRSKYKTFIDYVNPGYSVYNKRTSRLDAAINYTPVKFLTLSVEATNLLHDNTYSYFGAYGDLPVGVREQARTIQAGARFRF
jgi:TonB-dependent receptor